jgi:hypothetical protein
LCEIAPYQALFIAPCAHGYHYKCIKNLLRETHMFPCPICRQVANLEASVSMESLVDDTDCDAQDTDTKDDMDIDKLEFDDTIVSPNGTFSTLAIE